MRNCALLNCPESVQELIVNETGSDKPGGVAPLIRHIRIGQGGYDAVVDWGGIGRIAHHLKQLRLPPRVFLVTDSNIQPLYAPQVLQDLAQAGFEPHLYVVPAGEKSKSQEQLGVLYDWLIERQ